MSAGAERVDVLAVMDLDRRMALQESRENYSSEDFERSLAARNVVRELIEAVSAHRLSRTTLAELEARDRMYTALARVGGA